MRFRAVPGRMLEDRGAGVTRYGCCEHCQHDINDPPHDIPCPEGCEDGDGQPGQQVPGGTGS